MRRKIFLLIGSLLFISISYFGHQVLLIGSGFKAKQLCSAVFVNEREVDDVLGELHAGGFFYLAYFDEIIDFESPHVSISFAGLAERKAVFRKGLGCTLAIDTEDSTLEEQAKKLSISGKYANPREFWPYGSQVDTKNLPSSIDKNKLKDALEYAFIEHTPDKPHNTRAIVIAHKGWLVAEQYADGFSKDQALPGWSMSKSVLNTLAGVLVHKSKLALTEYAPIPQWQEDDRQYITVENLLHMSSGLKFQEDYINPFADAINMLFGSYSTALYAIDKSLKAEPGSEWGYSSGTSNIIAHLFKIIIADQGKYFTFPHTELFKPLGLEHVVFEPDAEGTYIGSSFMHATARDWARIGQLYLQNGVWNGKRLLPEGWVKYSIHPAPNAPENLYGSHIWLKPSPAHAKKEADFSQIPDDAYFFLGYEGQIVTIIPSLELVTVRLGLTRYSHAWHHPTFMGKVIAAITD